jgi:phospholipid/cholesterol/gamma-HCH transport system substrate-binding protein
MTNSRSKRSLGLGAAVLLLGVAATAYVLKPDDNHSSTVSAIFADANPIVKGNDVKASGVDVGTVKSVTLKDGVAVIEMEIDDALSPLHEDARATIKSKNLLGERFVEIDPGSADSPVLGRPAVIDASRTKREVDLQELLNAADTPTAKALGAMLTSLGEGFHGQGKQAAAAIKALAPAMTQSGELARILDDQNQLLTALIDDAQPAATALAGDHGTELDKLVNSMTQTLSAVAAQRQAAQDTLRQMPGTLVQARTTLARLSGVADPTTAVLRSLRPLTDDLTDISAELKAFSDAADPALASLQPVLERGAVMLDELGPLVRALAPAGRDLRQVGRAGRQLADTVLGNHLTQLMEFMKGWALATSDYDAISHYFRAIVPISPSPLGRGGAGPVPGLPSDPLGGLQLPQLPGLNVPKLPKVPGLNLFGTGSNGATGLTRKQENSLVNQLLGGN